jgi:hypothetical protein
MLLTATSMNAAIVAVTAKTARQPSPATTEPPTEGAIMGTTSNIVIIVDNARATSSSSPSTSLTA